MRVLVSGATGFVGRALCLALQRRGHGVEALVRSLARARVNLGDDVSLVPVGEDAALDEAAERCDGVINLAGENIFGGRWSAARKKALVESRESLTGRLVAAMGRASAPPEVLISASAVGFYGDRGPDRLDEEAPPGEGFLAELCQRWEGAALDAEAFGVRVALMRIGIVLGAGGGALAKVLPLFRLGLGGPLGSGRQYVPWIHLDDLVEVLCLALEDGRYRGAFNLTGPKPVTARSHARAIGGVLGKPALIPAPAPALRLILGEAAGAILSGQRAEPARLAELGYAHRHPSVEAALTDLLGPQHDPEIGPAPAELPGGEYLARRGARYLLRQTVRLDAPLEQVFDFFSRAGNLGAITPPEMAFEIITPRPIAMEQGTTIDYRIRLGPLPLPWRTVIERWEPGERFVDAQHRGPYRSWWHEHRFVAAGQQTVMKDRVYYAPPLGPLGALAHAVAIRRTLRGIFAYRTHQMRLRFGLADGDEA